MRAVFFWWREGAWAWYRFGMKLFSLFSMVGIGGMVALGCDGSGGGNSGGSGGGGSGAGTSAGGGGSTSTSAPCTIDEGLAEPVKVGFKSSSAPDGTDLPMVIDSVAADQLVLTDAQGEQLTFAWAGPDLTLSFTAGQSVTVDRPTGPVGYTFWHNVRSDTHLAAAFYHSYLDSAVGPPDAPLLEGLELELADACPEPESESYVNDFMIQAQVGSEVVLIKNHETAELPGFQVHNSGNQERRDTFGGEGEPETTHQNGVTVLRPLP